MIDNGIAIAKNTTVIDAAAGQVNGNIQSPTIIITNATNIFMNYLGQFS